MDRSRLEFLMRVHQAEIYRYLRYLGAARETAEDMVQETFLSAYTSDRAPDAEQDDARRWAGWLRGVARNLFLMHCRRDRASPVTADPAVLEDAEAAWDRRFLRGGDGFDYMEALRRCLEKLGEKQRSALDLRYARRASRQEMARALSMTEDGVKSLLRRLRGILAACVRSRLELERA